MRLRYLRGSLAVLLLCPALLTAQPLSDPGVPDGEVLVYQQTVDKKVSTLTVTTSHKTWQGKEVYEIAGTSPAADFLYRIGRPGLEQLYSLSRVRQPDTTIERQTAILRNQVKAGENEIVLLDFLSLEYLLRGYPLGKTKSLKVITGGQGMPGFTIHVNRLGDEVQKVGDQSVPCYRLELSISGIMAPFFPKSVFWYSLEAPHYLVRYEGASGGPGSAKRVLALTEVSRK